MQHSLELFLKFVTIMETAKICWLEDHKNKWESEFNFKLHDIVNGKEKQLVCVQCKTMVNSDKGR